MNADKQELVPGERVTAPATDHRKAGGPGANTRRGPDFARPTDLRKPGADPEGTDEPPFRPPHDLRFFAGVAGVVLALAIAALFAAVMTLLLSAVLFCLYGDSGGGSVIGVYIHINVALPAGVALACLAAPAVAEWSLITGAWYRYTLILLTVAVAGCLLPCAVSAAFHRDDWDLGRTLFWLVPCVTVPLFILPAMRRGRFFRPL